MLLDHALIHACNVRPNERWQMNLHNYYYIVSTLTVGSRDALAEKSITSSSFLLWVYVNS
eukprot:4245165-Pleurochrysis_carterae.AAC.2